MCGIAGLWMPRRTGLHKPIEAAVHSMLNTMHHRGPDDHGHWWGGDASPHLGHLRLSIVDLSPAGRQPMVSHDGRFAMVYNGEIFNFRELRKVVDDRRVRRWRGHSDSEVLLELIAEFGVRRAIQELDGQFGLAVWDIANRRLSLARDAFGEKPVYYGYVEGGLAFASEFQALLQVPGLPRDYDLDALALFGRLGYIPAPWSALSAVRKLRPGEILEFDEDNFGTRSPRAERFWRATDGVSGSSAAGREARSEGDWIETTESLLKKTVTSRMVADTPIGCLLSGGVDSTLVASFMAEATDGLLKTFTIGFENPELDEAPAARRTAELLGARHSETYFSDRQVMDVVSGIARTYGEPFADTAAIPTVLVSQVAGGNVKVALSGDGGDELFGGYADYYLADLFQRSKIVPGALRPIAGPVAGAVAFAVAQLRAAFGGAGGFDAKPDRARLRASGLFTRSTDLDYFWSLRATGPSSVLERAEFSTIGALDAELPEISARGGEADALRDLGLRLPDMFMVKVDRAAMRSSLEVRAPFLSRELHALSRSIPWGLKMRRGSGKWILRQILGRRLPGAQSAAPKKGFKPPLTTWLTTALEPWANDQIGSLRNRRLPWADLETVDRDWQDLRQSREQNPRRVWIHLMLAAWLNEMDRAPTPPSF